jgi:hypothetical protein
MSSFQQNIIKHKVGLLNLAVELGNVSKACQMMGMSRDTFYRYRNAHEAGGVQALLDANKRKPILKNRVDPSIEEAVIRFATDQPAFGQARTSNELRKSGMIVSSGGVRSIELRHNLETFAVGTLKGVERVYQQTFVDTYSKWAAAKMYTIKTPITAADLLNDIEHTKTKA